jgi:hypothetical protein
MERTEHRFMVHVWFEQTSDGGGQWRGAVDHVGSQRRLYFSSLSDVMDFMRLRLADPSKTAGTKRQDMRTTPGVERP